MTIALLQSIGTVLGLAMLLSGCGESASEYHENEKRDAVVRDQDREIVKLQERIQKLDRKFGCSQKASDATGECP